MDKTLLNLLLDWRGTVSGREYRAGASVLLMMALTTLSLGAVRSIDTMLVGREGIETLQAEILYRQLIGQYVPQLVPLGFLIAWGSFMLAFKRCRTLGLGKAESATSGIGSYLFFASFGGSLLTLYGQTPEKWVNPMLLWIVLGLFGLGLINTLVLCFAGGGAEPRPVKPARYDAVGYALLLGWLSVIALLTGVIAVAVFFVFALGGSSGWEAYLALIVWGVLVTGLYIYYAAGRLRDAGVTLGWLAILLPYAGIVALKYMGLSGKFVVSLLAALAVSAVIAGQYILFLLPSKKRDE